MASNTVVTLKLAWESIKSNRVRAILTLSIIAFGIMALIGILTAIEGLKSTITENFSSIGANTFTIRRDTGGSRRRGVDEKSGPEITYLQASRFKSQFHMPGTVALSVMATFNASLQYESQKTNPNVRVMGVDEGYPAATGITIQRGRFFSQREVEAGSNSVVIGADVNKKLFKGAKAVGEYVQIGNARYEVIGVLAAKGAALNNAADNQVLIPIITAMRRFTGDQQSVAISVVVKDLNRMNETVDESIALMRNVRRLPLDRENDFIIRQSDSAANDAMESLKTVTLAATLIGLITLFGAGIGLMNIMLVLVTERTREIGVSKALGATKGTIRMQFLTEAILICQLGGVTGIILGILVGNMISFFFQSGFIVPWAWVLGGISFCFIVGILAGIYPAVKASNLDPIDALRYE